MNFRIEIAGAGYDYGETDANDFALSAQRYAPSGARFYIDGRRVGLTTALDIASLYL